MLAEGQGTSGSVSVGVSAGVFAYQCVGGRPLRYIVMNSFNPYECLCVNANMGMETNDVTMCMKNANMKI